MKYHALINSLLLTAIGLTGQAVAASDTETDCGDKYLTAIELIGPISNSATPAQTPVAYRVWHQGQTRLLINAGPGSANSLLRSGMTNIDFDAIVFTQLRLEQTADLPQLINAARNQGRKMPLAIYGPVGSKFMSSTVSLVRSLFDQKRGSYRYLGEVLTPLGNNGYKLRAFDVNSRKNVRLVKNTKRIKGIATVYNKNGLSVTAVNTGDKHSPSLAIRINTKEAGMTIINATAQDNNALEALAKGSRYLMAHMGHRADNKDQNMLTASDTGRLAYRAQSHQLTISYQKPADSARQARDMAVIKNKYAGLVGFSQNGQCLPLAEKPATEQKGLP
ncbi:MAG: hypothetical protein IME93_02180 [Proteobacteria bacterium]|nr:hypothetical protein [Pseudomonadota bacterium]